MMNKMIAALTIIGALNLAATVEADRRAERRCRQFDNARLRILMQAFEEVLKAIKKTGVWT